MRRFTVHGAVGTVHTAVCTVNVAVCMVHAATFTVIFSVRGFFRTCAPSSGSVRRRDIIC